MRPTTSHNQSDFAKGAGLAEKEAPGDFQCVPPEDRSALEKTALWGTLWTVVTYGSSQILRFISSIVLSRLLAPELFGLMAIVNTLLLGLHLFTDVGLMYSVIQSKRGDDPVFLNTTWTVQCGRGVILWALTVAMAWPIALFYHQPRIALLFPVAGLGMAISGFSSTNFLTAARHMKVGLIGRLELTSQLIQILTSITFAWISPGPWALVAGSLAADISRTLLSHVILPGIRNRFTLDPDAVKTVISFAKLTFLSTGLMFLSSQTDRLILGKLISLRLLGIYGIAYTLSDIPRQVIVAFSSRIGVPFLTKFAHLPRPEFRETFKRYRLYLLMGAAVVLAVAINAGDLLLVRLYDKRYHEAALMMPLLALGLWHTLLYSTSGPALMAIGKLKYNVAGYFGTFLAMLLLLPLAYHFLGMRGAVILVAFSDVPMYIAIARGQVKERLGAFKQDALATGMFAAFLLAGMIIRSLNGLASPFAPWR